MELVQGFPAWRHHEVASGAKTDRAQLRKLLAGLDVGDVVMSPDYTVVANRAVALREEAADVEKSTQSDAKQLAYHQAQGDERWRAMGTLRQYGHRTGVRPDPEMSRHEQGEKFAAERLAEQEKRRDALAKELPAAELAEAEALEKVRPAAERKLSDLQERAAVAREVMAEKVQEQGERERVKERQRVPTRENNRGMER